MIKNYFSTRQEAFTKQYQKQPMFFLWAVFLLAFSLAAACPASAAAEVRGSDVIYGETVNARGIGSAQCPDIDAEHAIVMGSDGTVYFERDAYSPAQIASLTKIMTAVVVLDAVDEGLVDLKGNVGVSSEAASIGESSAGLREGDIITLDNALIALLVPSGNDAAIALAETVGAALMKESYPDAENEMAAFVQAMNDKAQELGCKDSVFENPHGLDSNGYEGSLHSTAYDMALIVAYAMQNETFREDVALGDTTISVRRDGVLSTVDLESTDLFSKYSSYAIGVKTGYTQAAGHCFAAATSKDGLELYTIVLESTSEVQRFKDAAELSDWAYLYLTQFQFANSDEVVSYEGKQVYVVAEIAHDDWLDKTVEVTLSEPEASMLVFALNGNVVQDFEFYSVTGNVHVGDVLGEVRFKQRNAVIASYQLVAVEDVQAPTFFEGVAVWWTRALSFITGAQKEATSYVVNELPLLLDKNS